jgi:hypothetical protein
VSIPDHVVIRAASDLPPGFLPAALNGKWLDRAQLSEESNVHHWGSAVAVATGRFEVREDGAVAEVFEMHA